MGWIDNRKEKHPLTVCWSTLNFSALTQAVDSKHSRELVKHLLRIKMDQCTGIQIPIRPVVMKKKKIVGMTKQYKNLSTVRVKFGSFA